jgi:tripartite ATP-independent transporter DctP family solute receptor
MDDANTTPPPGESGRWTRRGLLGSLLVATALLPVAAASAAEVTLRLGHPVLLSHPYHDASLRFSEAVKKRTNGAVEIQIFPARQLGDVRELLNGVKFGTIDLTFSDVSAYPQLQSMQFPWLITSYQHLANVVKLPETRAMLAPKLDSEGIEMLTIYEGGRFSFLTVRREVNSLNDLRGLKTRVAPVRMHLEIWQAIGTNPTPVAYGELYTALETGTIDALGINLTSIYSEKFYEIGKHVLQTNHNYWPAMLVMNKRKFSSLSAEHQKAIRDAAMETSEPQIMAVDRAEQDLIAKLKGLGVSIRPMPDSLRTELMAKAQPVVDKYAAADAAVPPFIAAVKKAAQ